MERPTFKPIGTPVEELDTPALVIDLDALEANVAAVHAAVGASGASVRPRLDAHLCPAIGHAQRAASATSGAAVATLAQAETFAQYGFDDILIVNLLATRVKTGRAAALARRVGRLIVSADSERNIADLSDAASAAGSTLGVAIAVRERQPILRSDSRRSPRSRAARVRLARTRTGGLGRRPKRGVGRRAGARSRRRLRPRGHRDADARRRRLRVLRHRARVRRDGRAGRFIRAGRRGRSCRAGRSSRQLPASWRP